MKRVYVLCLFLMLTGLTAQATVPSTIAYQGYLTTPAGVPMDTTVQMTFKFYGFLHVPLWTEVHPAVTVTDGLFTVQLGSSVTLPDSIFSSGFTILEVTVGADSPMFPSTQLSSVPYSYLTGTVDGALGGHVIGSLNVGMGNSISGDISFIAGQNNAITNGPATITGGTDNSNGAVYGFIGAGVMNVINSAGGVCVGGYENQVTSIGAANSIGGGYHNAILGTNGNGTVSGGHDNSLTGGGAAIGGGGFNRARGSHSAIAGGGGSELADSNAAAGLGSFVGGGQRNFASDDHSVVCGGYDNTASGEKSFVGAGTANSAEGLRSAVGAGYFNSATGQDATIGGGYQNTASGSTSTVPGGVGNEATGNFSTAMGFRAKALHTGALVWADNTLADFASTAANQVSLRASGGVRIATTTAGGVGVKLDNGDTAWEVLSDSTMKANRRAANTRAILDKVMALKIQEWNYTHQDERNTHIGPMAQDFHRLFEYGDDETTISTIDPDGVALAAIQELARRNADLEARVKQLEEMLLQFGASQLRQVQEEKQ